MKKIIILGIGFIVFLGIISVYLYQNLVNIGSQLADEHCLKVNPLITQRKNNYISLMQTVISYGAKEKFQKDFIAYFDISKKYIVEETNWLSKHKEFTDKWEYKLFIHDNIKKLMEAQYTAYEAEKDVSQLLLDELNTTDVDKQQEIHNTIVAKTEIGSAAYAEYNRLWKMPRSDWDIRKYIAKVPVSKCPEENMNIPEVPDYLGINK